MEHREAALGPALEADGVRVGIGRGDDALVVLQLLDGAESVAQLGGIFKAQLLGGGLHALLQILRELVRLALENQHRLVDAAAVFLCGRVLETVAGAGAHVVIEAGSGLANVAREAARARRQAERLGDRVDDLVRDAAAAVGAEITRAVLRRLVGEGEGRIFRAQIEPDKGIALVVLEEDVIVRLVELDEGVFQHKRLKLGIDHDDVEIRHMVDHRGDLRQVLAAEIARDAVFERLGLADIDDGAGFIEHEIDAGL